MNNCFYDAFGGFSCKINKEDSNKPTKSNYIENFGNKPPKTMCQSATGKPSGCDCKKDFECQSKKCKSEECV